MNKTDQDVAAYCRNCKWKYILYLAAGIFVVLPIMYFVYQQQGSHVLTILRSDVGRNKIDILLELDQRRPCGTLIYARNELGDVTQHISSGSNLRPLRVHERLYYRNVSNMMLGIHLNEGDHLGMLVKQDESYAISGGREVVLCKIVRLDEDGAEQTTEYVVRVVE